jgi:hypothetical protein
MTSNATQVLGLLMRQLTGVHLKQEEINKNFSKMAKLAAVVGTAFAGAAILEGMTKVIEAGDKLVVIQNRLKAGGVSDAGVTLLTRTALNTALTVPGTSYTGNLNLGGDLRAALGNTADAAAALPDVAKSAAALNSAGISSFSGEGALADTLKSLDIMGAGMKNGAFDPATFAEAFKNLVQVEMQTNGMLTPTALLQIAKTGGFAAQGIDFKEFLASQLATFLELGSRAGSGLAQAEMEFVGGNASLKTIGGLQQYGLIGKDGYTHEDGHYALKPGALTGYADLLQKGMGYWVSHDLLPKLHAEGVTSAPAIIAALTQILGSVRAARYFMAQSTPAGQAMTQRDYDNAQASFNTQPYDQTQQSTSAQLKDINAAFETLITELGAPLVPVAVNMLKQLTGAILWLATEVSEHPTAATIVSEIAIGLSALAVAVGAFAVGAAAASALAFLAGPLGLTAAASGLVVLAGGIHALLSSYGDKIEAAATGRTPAEQEAYKKKLDALHDKGWDQLKDYLGLGTKGIGPDMSHPMTNAPIGSTLLQHDSYIAPTDNRPHIQTIVYTQLDGRTIAKTVSEEQSRDWSLPQSGSTRFDGSQTPSFPGQTIRV